MADVRVFFKSIVFFTALSLIAFALTPNANLDFLLKSLALAFGLSLLTPFAYPHIRGVREGDVVSVVLSEQKLPFKIPFMRSTAVALTSGRIGDVIKIEFSDGSEEEGVVVSYAGFFTPAKVKLVQKEIRVV